MHQSWRARCAGHVCIHAQATFVSLQRARYTFFIKAYIWYFLLGLLTHMHITLT
jgi:hypothetical protein